LNQRFNSAKLSGFKLIRSAAIMPLLQSVLIGEGVGFKLTHAASLTVMLQRGLKRRPANRGALADE
jgi:hypothetical protein